MSDSTTRALLRLQDPADPAATELAGLVARQVRDVPLADLVPVDRVAEIWASGWRALAASEGLAAWIRDRVDEATSTAGDIPGTVRDQLPVGVPEVAQALLGQPFVPSEELVFRLANQPALQSLVGHVIAEAVRSIGRRLKHGEEAPEPGRGRAGELRGLLRSVRDNIGGVAGTIVEVVREEVDVVFEGRMTAAVDSANERAIRTLACYLADPVHAAEFARARTVATAELLDSRVDELAAQAGTLSVERMVDELLAAVRAIAALPDLDERVRADVRRGVGAATGRTLGEVLDELDLAEPWDELATALAEPAIRSLVGTAGFAAFWSRLHA